MKQGINLSGQEPAAPIHSKFNPVPHANKEKTGEPKSEPEKPKELKEDKTYLYLNDEYKVRLKPDSGYRIFLSFMAVMGKFSEASNLLDYPGFNPKNKAQACKLIEMLLVRREVVIQAMGNDPKWIQHGQKKLRHLMERAAKGNKQAQATLKNPERVSGRVWVGNIQEIVSTCCGAYSCDPEKNRNTRKFDEGGITFRKYPLNPSRDEPVYIMMFPLKHVTSVHDALVTVYDEPNEVIPLKHLMAKYVADKKLIPVRYLWSVHEHIKKAIDSTKVPDDYDGSAYLFSRNSGKINELLTLEVSIAADPGASFRYAKEIIGDRFISGEKSISGSKYDDDYRKFLYNSKLKRGNQR